MKEEDVFKNENIFAGIILILIIVLILFTTPHIYAILPGFIKEILCGFGGYCGW